MSATFSLNCGPKIGEIDPITDRPVLVRHIRRSYLMAAQHLLGRFVAIQRSESTVAWQFTDKLPRAISRMICWEMLLIQLGHNPLELGALHLESVAVTQHDWLVLAGVLEIFKGTSPQSKRAIETCGEADECRTEWVQKTTWDFSPSVEIIGKHGENFAEAVRAAVKQGRIKLGRKTPIAGLMHCVRDESEAAIAFHTALRLQCDSSPTMAAYHFIHTFEEADSKRFARMLHAAIRMNADKTTLNDFVEGVSKRMTAMQHLEFQDHGYLWRSFCCILSSFSKADWEGAVNYLVSFGAKDATVLPVDFLKASEET